MTDIRWKQRFENLDKAYNKFLLVVEAIEKEPENEIYQMALVQAFEFVYELSWKTVKDYLLASGIQDANLPRDVIKKGFHYKIIKDGQLWIDMMLDRNILSHTYNEQKAKEIAKKICSEYQNGIKQVHKFFEEKSKEV